MIVPAPGQKKAGGGLIVNFGVESSQGNGEVEEHSEPRPHPGPRYSRGSSQPLRRRLGAPLPPRLGKAIGTGCFKEYAPGGAGGCRREAGSFPIDRDRKWLQQVHFPFPPRAPRCRASSDPGLRTPPAQQVPPTGPRAAGSPLRARGRDSSCPPAPGVPRLPAGRATVPRHVGGGEGTVLGPGRGVPGPGRGGRSRPRGQAAGLRSSHRAGAGERLQEQQKRDLKVRRAEEAKWLSLPRQPVLTRRLHVGGKLQTSVENSDTPGTNNDKRNNNDNSDNALPYIKI
ncbi:translation initiation factor IF-2-like [Strigops habroptila]|uniref:translation initiation factor IF-2-like n=1 Tax=Strigops habroptila TaxID=2489341 RepID=UPI0011CF33D9|nr:translation initiation factor IF-2-like [Strigops habroptila]